MKTTVTFVLTALPFICFAQGNLQFNQVLNLTNGANYTVPTGKVLKVESVNVLRARTNGFFSGYVFESMYSSGTYFKYGCKYTFYEDSLCISAACITAAPSGTWNIGSVDINTSPPYDTIGSCPLTRLKNSESPNIPFRTPIWLHAGQQINIFAGVGALVSGIEFNIVP